MSEVVERRFRDAARAYLIYGIVYYVGGLYMLWHGVGVAGSMEGRRINALAFWAIAGLVPMLGIPYLLARPRAAFERWVLSRRDFTRIVALFLLFRSYKVGQVILDHHGGSVPAPWGGTITFQVGAVVFTLITLYALVMMIRAGWGSEPAGEAPEPVGSRHA